MTALIAVVLCLLLPVAAGLTLAQLRSPRRRIPPAALQALPRVWCRTRWCIRCRTRPAETGLTCRGCNGLSGQPPPPGKYPVGELRVWDDGQRPLTSAFAAWAARIATCPLTTLAAEIAADIMACRAMEGALT
jgi:hypothetical protein